MRSGVALPILLTICIIQESRAWHSWIPPIGDRFHQQNSVDDERLPDMLCTSKVYPPSSRRSILSSSLVATGTLLLSGIPASAISTTSNSLPWVKDPINPKRTPLKIKDAENLGYNLEFVTYFTRFLLNFDPLAQQWWIDKASAIPRRALPDEIFAIRQEQFSKLAASVELGLLQEFPGPDGPSRLLQSLLERFPVVGDTSDAASTTTLTMTDVKQQRALRETKEARRQLALLFGLLNDYQPTAQITKLLASVDNGSITTVEVLEPSPRGFAPDDELPTLELSPPQAGEEYNQAIAKPIMTPTGGLLRIDIIERHEDSASFRKAPTVMISPPAKGGAGGRPAQAVARLRNGSLVGIELTDPGEGYTEDDRIHVRLETEEGSAIASVKCLAVLELRISGVVVANAGNGYAVEKPVRLLLVNKNGIKDLIGYGYPEGLRGSFEAYRQSGDNRVRTFERKLDEPEDEESDGNTRIISGSSSGGGLPPLPFTSKASSSRQLLSLLPQGFGLAYDKETKRYFLVVDNEMMASTYATSPTFASSSRLVPDFGPRGESPIERNMNLDLSTFLRLSLAGAICSSGKSNMALVQPTALHPDLCLTGTPSHASLYLDDIPYSSRLKASTLPSHLWVSLLCRRLYRAS
jgi:hypothetical protein